jgi:hypothetical protein
MPAKRRPPDNQLILIDVEPTLPIIAKPKKKGLGLIGRTENLEKRVTQLEAEVALIIGQLEQSEDDD